MYPYRIRITDPILIKCFQDVSTYRVTRISNPNITKRIGHKIPRTIKRDGIYIKDGIFAITNPCLKLDFKPSYGKKKGYDFIIKNIF